MTARKYRRLDPRWRSSAPLETIRFSRVGWRRFGINYNTIDERYKKGSVLVRTVITDEEPSIAVAPTGPVLVASLEASPQQEEGSETGTRKFQELSHREGVYDEPRSSVTQAPGSAGPGDLGVLAAGNSSIPAPRHVDSSASNEAETLIMSQEVDEGAVQRTTSSAGLPEASSPDQPEHSVTQTEEALLKEDTWEKGDSKSELISTISETSPNAHLDVSPLPTENKRDGKKESKRKAKKAATAVKMRIDLLHCDVIKDAFWDARPELLDD
ncbi:hypothetical protein BDQ17DRAFT_1324009 [Cyathus striatus]|nr:hypothetical protein BDQ17DRAFT_1324009 [Cyathus striatus]